MNSVMFFIWVHRMISSRKVAEDAYEYSNNIINEADNAD
jgi:hypothetical protein